MNLYYEMELPMLPAELYRPPIARLPRQIDIELRVRLKR